jgi:cell cycle checkpoint protein
MELGGILKAKDALGSSPRPPVSHRLFSNLGFTFGKSFGNMQQLNEGDLDLVDEPDEGPPHDVGSLVKEKQDGGWLDSDDIEDF